MNNQQSREIIIEFLSNGKKEEAIVYTQEKYNVSAAEAKKLVEVVEKNEPGISPVGSSSNSSSGCGGCFNVVFKIMSVFIGIWALMFLSAFAFVYYIVESEKGDLEPVEAIVAGAEEGPYGKEHLIVTYTWESNTYRDTIDYAIEPNKYQVGEEIEVLIHPDHPTPAVLEEELHQNFLQTFKSASETEEIGNLQGLQWMFEAFTLVFLLPGLFFLLLSIFLWWLGGRFVAREKP